MKLNDIQSRISQLITRLKWRQAVPVAAMALLAVVIGVVAITGPDSLVGAAPGNQRGQSGQVDAANGSPRSGRDPASQRQTSLSAAAAAPAGNGLRTDKPAASVKGDHSHHATSSDVHSDPGKTGINSAGCFIDYGIPGEQCLPAGLADKNGSLSCAAVRQHFPNGLKVSGQDRFKLDKNKDGTACGSGD